ncbi:MAG TPA: hypothetical protein VFZ21_12930 [Gemmatimonadaceae bacterium]|nr:hypothetical protein [Gemmatimonadaceae bacterium]
MPLAEAVLSRSAGRRTFPPDGIRAAVVRAASHHIPGGTRYTNAGPTIVSD